MPGFYPGAQAIQNPDVLGSYLRGAMAPGIIQGQQIENQAGQLKLEQLRTIMDYSKQLAAGTPTTQGADQQQASGFNPSIASALDVLQGRDPMATAKSAQDYEIKQRQLQAQGPLALLDSISGSANPARVVMNNPGLMQRWQQIAPQLGLDPVKDFSDDNVRQVVGFARNQVAGAAGLPTKEQKLPAQMSEGPLGSRYSTDPITHAVSQVKPEESLHSVMGPDGQPILKPSSEAAGMEPFSPSVFGAANLNDQTKEFAYQKFLATGELPTGLSRNATMQAALLSYVAKRAAEEGNSAASIAANGQAFKARQGVVKEFESSKPGSPGGSITAINTAVKHMDSLEPLIDALGTGDIRLINKATNAYQQQTGSAAPTNFAALKEFVAGEVAKAVLPGGGGELERRALAAPLDAANSPQAIHEAVNQIAVALAGKTEALRNQWDVGTAGTQGSFDKFLLPETKKALGIKGESTSDHPPDIQSLLDKYK